jgi:glycosyltransferase involved in cell wall biosynthesis
MRLSGLKRVVHVHLDTRGEGLQWALRHPPELIITCAKFLIPHVREALSEGLQERQQIAAVPNAVDTERFYPLEKQAAKQCVGAPNSIPLLLMLANLAPHKGQETAIRATALLKQRGIDVSCWLAGCERERACTYTAKLQILIRDLGVADQVQLLGFRSDAPDLLRAADFLLLPSTCEGLPLSVLEAQASKTVVLANATAGVPEVIADGKTGFLIPADDAAGYARRIEALLREPAQYHGIAEQACTRVLQEHSWQTYQQRIWGLYQDVLGDGARRQPLEKAAARPRLRAG